mgnify:CR=1 FL=1
MKVLILGGDGKLGPWVVKALEGGDYDLRVTDVNEPDTPHDRSEEHTSELQSQA